MKRFIINPISQFERISKNIDAAVNDIENSINPKICCQPKMDIFETATSYEFSIELPGMQKEDILLSIDEENILIIKGNKKSNANYDSNSFIRFERNYGNFERKFSLPDDANRSNVNAKYESGVLSVTISKYEPAKPEEINITIL